jgi:hypothetical protein
MLNTVFGEDLLCEEYQSVNNNQVLDYRRNRLKIAHSYICHPEKFWAKFGMFLLLGRTLTII